MRHLTIHITFETWHDVHLFYRVCELVERLVKFGKEADLSPSSCTTPPPSSSHQPFDPQSTSSPHPSYSEPSAIGI